LSISQNDFYKNISAVTLRNVWCGDQSWHGVQHIQNPAQDHLWILQKHKPKYFTFLFFKQKLRLKSIYTSGESCSSCYTKHNKIRFAIFGFFCNLLWILQVSAKTHKGVRNLFARRPLDSFPPSQIYPRIAQNTLEVLGASQCGPRAMGAARPGGIPATSPATSAGKCLGRL
jgi:hypothetical protein